MLFQITSPANNERGPRYMEKAFAAIHQAKPRHAVTLVYGAKLWELSANTQGAIFTLLLRKSDDRGGGDFRDATFETDPEPPTAWH